MRRKLIILVLAACAVGGLFLLLRESDAPNVDDVAELARREAASAADRAADEKRRQTDLAYLAKLGKGQDLPEYLVSRIDLEGNFWFVGKPDNVAGVQIPFKPGALPRPKDTGDAEHPNPGFLGADACRECHQDKYDTFIHTAHHRTSRFATPEEVSGSFASTRNRMETSEPNVHFKMEQRGEDLYQQVSFFDWQFEVPFDLIIGSSKMAESYLYWHGDQLFQMNCTYLTEQDDWINSPGFIDGDAIYARPIRSGCLDCHVTYVDYRKSANHYTPKSLILGISCERCHGPGKDHVEYHQANPDKKESKHMAVPSKLSRQAQMDVCGQCHTTKKAPIDQQAFQFRPGDKLSDHYEKLEGEEDATNSVHTSNQVGRLSLSACFQQSEMGCVECHNPHRNERDQLQLFSNRCMKCHQQEQCGMSDKLGASIAENCIDCHMPIRASENLQVETAAGNVFPPLRDHYIRVDPLATEEFLQLNSKSRDDDSEKRN